jgi:hypothetical protein
MVQTNSDSSEKKKNPQRIIATPHDIVVNYQNANFIPQVGKNDRFNFL